MECEQGKFISSLTIKSLGIPRKAYSISFHPK